MACERVKPTYHPEGAEFLHANGQTGMTTLTVAFRDFANAPYNNTLFRKLDLFPSTLEGGGAGGRHTEWNPIGKGFSLTLDLEIVHGHSAVRVSLNMLSLDHYYYLYYVKLRFESSTG